MSKESLQRKTIEVLPQMNSGELAKLAAAMAANGPLPSLSDTYEAVQHTATSRAANTSPAALVDMAHSFAEGERRGMRRAPQLFDAIGRSAAGQGLGSLEPRDVSKLVHAFSSVGHRSSPSIFEAAGATALSRFHAFGPGDASMLLWCMAVADSAHEELFESRTFSNFIASATAAGTWNDIQLSQLHQFLLWATAERKLLSAEALPSALPGACLAAFTSSPAQPSLLQLQVAEQLQVLGYRDVEHEHATEEGYSIDLVVKASGLRVGVEVDGPSHFLGDSEVPTGATRLKRRQLRAFGWALLPVPYFRLSLGNLGEQRYGDVYAALNLRDALEGMLGPLHQAYHVLGLHRMTSSEAELKAAYRRCLLEHHPDRVEFSGRGSKEEAEERTREIVEAFELISSAEAVPGRRQQAAWQSEEEEGFADGGRGEEVDYMADLRREARRYKRAKVEQAEAEAKAAEAQLMAKEREKEVAERKAKELAEQRRRAADQRRMKAAMRAKEEQKQREESAKRQVELEQQRRAEVEKEAEIWELFWAAPKLNHWQHTLKYMSYHNVISPSDLIYDSSRLIRHPIQRLRSPVVSDSVVDQWFQWAEDMSVPRVMILIGERRDGGFESPFGFLPERDDYTLAPAPTLRMPPVRTLHRWFITLAALAYATDRLYWVMHDASPERIPEPPSLWLLRDERYRHEYAAPFPRGLGLTPCSWHLDRLGDFFEAHKFAGARDGFVFKTGERGLGYYRDGGRADDDDASAGEAATAGGAQHESRLTLHQSERMQMLASAGVATIFALKRHRVLFWVL